MIHISSALTLLAIVAGMFLLAKTNKDNLGRFFKLVSYLVVIGGLLLLLCDLGRGIIHMTCYKSAGCLEGNSERKGGGCPMSFNNGNCHPVFGNNSGCMGNGKSPYGCCNRMEKGMSMRGHCNLIDRGDPMHEKGSGDEQGKTHVQHDEESCDEVGCKWHHDDQSLPKEE